jgi:hypothetical protein
VRFVPRWLHCRLIRFQWYRRQCGLKPMPTTIVEIVNEALRKLERDLQMRKS